MLCTYYYYYYDNKILQKLKENTLFFKKLNKKGLRHKKF